MNPVKARLQKCRRHGTWISAAFGMVFCLQSAAYQAEVPPMPAHRLDPAIQKIVSEISEDRIAEILKRLESFETRNTLSDPSQPNRGIGAARQWIHDQFKSYSPRLEVSFDSHTIPPGGRIWKEVDLRNVVAVLPGKMEQARDRWILVTGHYDSLNLRVPEELRSDRAKAVEIPAPGVTDDGSGTACVMECARVLSQCEFDATLVFVALAGEEQGLLGARAMAKRFKEKNQEIQAVLNNDIIGSEISGNGKIDNGRVLVFSEDPNDSGSRQIARFVKRIAERYYPEMVVDMVFRHDRFGRGGDHTAFNQQAYPGIRFTTPNENFAHQHSATDTLVNASVPYTARVVRLNAAAAAALALAPRAPVTMATQAGQRREPATTAEAPPEQTGPAVRGRPRGPGISRGAGYDAVLRWEHPSPEPDLAGYIVVMRSTLAPDWEREVWAGNVREFTIENIPIVLGYNIIWNCGYTGSTYTLSLC